MTNHFSSASRRCLPALLFVQLLTFTLAQAAHMQDGSNVAREQGLSSTMPYDEEYDADMEGDVYDEADGLPDISSTIPPSAEHFDAELNNNTLHQHEASEYQDDPYAYHDTSNDLEEDDDDNSDDHIFADTMSVNRPESKRPTIDFNPVDRSSTARSPFSAFNHWQGLFSRPSMLVGLVGGVTLGILSLVLLLMFIVYRMRKRDEGSYVLDEGPRKSPSHTYTRVSSREFFA